MSAGPARRNAPAPLRSALADATAALGIELSAQQSECLLAFVALLAHWNQTYNLTAVREPAAMLTQHVVDCLAAVPALRRQRRAGRVLDVGSGGGLPGVVWAIVDPGLDVTCVDSVGKKAAFIRQTAGELGLGNLHGEHARVESLKADDAFDLITARAFASLADFVGASRHLLKDGGAWVAMKGKVPSDEIAALLPDTEVFHVEPLQVPGLEAERCLVWLRPRHLTSSIGMDSGESMRSHSAETR